MASGKQTRLSPPIMYAFRAANRARDAKVAIDKRTADGERLLAGRRATRTAVTESVIRAEVTQDLDALLNTVNLAAACDLRPYEEVARSILNFGLPDISTRTIDSMSNTGMAREIADTILLYEPRLIPGTIKVARDTSVSKDSLKVRFRVAADMACDPVAVPVEFLAELERTTGKIEIARA